jgi:hypothetical protein
VKARRYEAQEGKKTRRRQSWSVRIGWKADSAPVRLDFSW